MFFCSVWWPGKVEKDELTQCLLQGTAEQCKYLGCVRVCMREVRRFAIQGNRRLWKYEGWTQNEKFTKQRFYFTNWNELVQGQHLFTRTLTCPTLTLTCSTLTCSSLQPVMTVRPSQNFGSHSTRCLWKPVFFFLLMRGLWGGEALKYRHSQKVLFSPAHCARWGGPRWHTALVCHLCLRCGTPVPPLPPPQLQELSERMLLRNTLSPYKASALSLLTLLA